MTSRIRFTSLSAYAASLGVLVGYSVFLALVLGIATPLSPAPVNQGDKCFRCARTIVRTRLAGEIVGHDRLAYKFRAPACMAQYLNEHQQPPESLAGIFVADHTSGLLIPAQHAWFVETIVDPETGERDFAAFSVRGSAEAYARSEHAPVVRWAAVMAEGARRARAGNESLDPWDPEPDYL